jgi:tetratricopeptide (TPR) repeat protein
VLADRGRFDDARAEFERAGVILEASLGPEHPDVARALDGQAQALHGQGDVDEAIARYERALAIRQAALGDDHPTLALSFTNIGLLHAKAGRHADAIAPLRRGVALVEAAYGDGEQLVTALNALAEVLVEVGEVAEATPLYDRGIAIGERIAAADLGTLLTGRAELHVAAGAASHAEPLLRRALELWAAQTGEDQVHEGYTRYALAHALWQLDRPEEARGEARAALQYLVEADPPMHAEAMEWLERRRGARPHHGDGPPTGARGGEKG